MIKHLESGEWAVIGGNGDILHRAQSNGAAWLWLDRQERRKLWARRETAESTGAVYYKGLGDD